MEERSVEFSSTGPAGVHRDTRMGRYSETSQVVQGCPVFEQVEKQEDEKQYFLFVGPDGSWRVGPDVTSYSGSVLKNTKKNTKGRHPNRFDFMFVDYSKRSYLQYYINNL